MNAVHAFRRHLQRESLATLTAADQQLWEAINRARARGKSASYLYWMVRPRREICEAAKARCAKL